MLSNKRSQQEGVEYRKIGRQKTEWKSQCFRFPIMRIKQNQHNIIVLFPIILDEGFPCFSQGLSLSLVHTPFFASYFSSFLRPSHPIAKNYHSGRRKPKVVDFEKESIHILHNSHSPFHSVFINSGWEAEVLRCSSILHLQETTRLVALHWWLLWPGCLCS